MLTFSTKHDLLPIDTNLALVQWTMPGMLLEETCGFQFLVYSKMHKMLLSSCIKTLVVTWFLFWRISKYHFYFWYFEFSYSLGPFSSMSSPGLIRRQFKKNLILKKRKIDTRKLTLESKNYIYGNLLITTNY